MGYHEPMSLSAHVHYVSLVQEKGEKEYNMYLFKISNAMNNLREKGVRERRWDEMRRNTAEKIIMKCA